MRERLIAGVMTGTSLDGVDAAAVRVLGSGLAIETRIEAFAHEPLGGCAETLRRLARGEPTTALTIARLGRSLGQRCADAVRRLQDELGGRFDFVVVHGQTVAHAPPVTWQLVDPWPVALAVKAPVLCDLRGADAALDGEAAPITPLADWLFYRDRSGASSVAVVNLGGFANATLLPAGGGVDAVEGFDICACNHALDEAARLALGAPFDEDGAAAHQGAAQREAVEAISQLLAAQACAGRSLGEEDARAAQALVGRLAQSLAPADLLASVVEAVAQTIAQTLARRGGGADRTLLAGGSAKNRALVAALARRLPGVELTDAHGPAAHEREAAAMAALGALCADGLAVTLPRVTGATRAQELADGAWVNVRPWTAT